MSDSSDVQALRDEINELRTELNRMKDRQAILEVLHRYSKGLDRRDWELMKSAYHEDGLDRHGDFIGHPDTFVAWAADLFQDEWDYSLHFLDPNNIEIDGDVAHSECYVLFTQRRTDGSALEFGGGRYIDRLERRNGEWRISARLTAIDWSARADVAVFGGTDEYQIGTWDKSDPSYRRPLELELP